MGEIKPAVFFDRDGTLNIDKGYVYRTTDFKWNEGAREAIKYLNDKNYYIFVVTNQSGIGRGYFSENDVITLHNFIKKDLKSISAKIDDFFYSPYHPKGINNNYDHLSNLRKPKTGMLELAEQKWNIDKSKSFMIGDKESDVECGRNYGIKSFLFDNSQTKLDDLVVRIIEQKI